MFVNGRADHNVHTADMVEHIVRLVEDRAAKLKAEREAEQVPAG